MENATIDVKFEILQGSPTGSLAWTETHSNISTNSLGLFSLKVGDIVSMTVDWTTGSYYLDVEIDMKDGNGFRDFGTAELLSVPYALHAANAGENQTLSLTGTSLTISGGNSQDLVGLVNDADANPTNEIQDLVLAGDVLSLTMDPTAVPIDLSPYSDNPWTLNGASNDTLLFPGSVAIGSGMPNGSKLAVQGDDVLSEKPLFEVKRQDGQTVFAVYNDSIRMYVDDGTVWHNLW